MQTYLVHMRAPRRLWRELGARRFLGLQVLMGGLILSALVHPWFYVLVALDLWQGRLLGVPGFGAWAVAVVDRRLQRGRRLRQRHRARQRRRPPAAAGWGSPRMPLLMPVYWLGISFAAYRALAQLVLGALLLGEDGAFRAGMAHRAPTQPIAAGGRPIAAE